MKSICITRCHAQRFTYTGSPLSLLPAAMFAVALVSVLGIVPVYAGTVGIQGTMSNFDVFNETGTNVYGAELDLDGVHSADVTKTYPSHFNHMTMTDYSSGAIVRHPHRVHGVQLPSQWIHHPDRRHEHQWTLRRKRTGSRALRIRRPITADRHALFLARPVF